MTAPSACASCSSLSIVPGLGEGKTPEINCDPVAELDSFDKTNFSGCSVLKQRTKDVKNEV